MGGIKTSGFQRRVLDKVERLLDLLEDIQGHPALTGKLAMHGGTAINLFMLDVPRLSVDIDISYIGALSRDRMMEERPQIEAALIEIAEKQGYGVSPKKDGHAGRSFSLNYRNEWGLDSVKIDCIYMNRSPLFPLTRRQTTLRPGVEVLMFDDLELAGGKVKAFFDRVKVRDLYDIANLGQFFESSGHSQRDIHRALLYYASLSATFPNDLAGREKRFSRLEAEYESQLLPMLNSEGRRPSLGILTEETAEFIDSFVLPQTADDASYLEHLAKGDFRPELLFGEGELAEAARKSPEALWKVQNLKRMAARSPEPIGYAGISVPSERPIKFNIPNEPKVSSRRAEDDTATARTTSERRPSPCKTQAEAKNPPRL